MTQTGKLLGMKQSKKIRQHCKGRLLLQGKGKPGKRSYLTNIQLSLKYGHLFTDSFFQKQRKLNLRKSSDVHLLSWRVHFCTSTFTEQSRIIWTAIYLIYQRIAKCSIYNTKIIFIATCVSWKELWKWLLNSNTLLPMFFQNEHLQWWCCCTLSFTWRNAGISIFP